MDSIFKLKTPKNPLPLIFDSPHSGTDYPADFRYACPFEELEKAEDKYVDDLFSSVINHGGTFLCALFPRSYIDVNRAADDIDTELTGRYWPQDTHGPIHPTSRSDAGIGLIRRLVKPGMPLYNRELSPDEILNRVYSYYISYHNKLEQLIENALVITFSKPLIIVN